MFTVAPGGSPDPTVTRNASHELMLDPKTGHTVKDQTLVMRLSDLRSQIAGALSGVASIVIARPNGTLPKLCIVALAMILLGGTAEAYYHYVYYYRTSPFFPIQAKFDLSRLTNSNLVFTVADSGPATFYPNDSFGSVLAEVKQALAAWNSVQSSSLRVTFGGLQPASQNSNTPGAEIVFQNLGPGLLGLTSVSVPASPSFSGQFVPIAHSQVMLTNNTSQQPGPSYYETFFTTAVHEIGHALGLQHTWTASAMSQGTIRNTSRARPIDADDMAGLSVLYPAPNWSANFGTISGRVSYSNGSAVALASVVAIPNSGPAVSVLTNPDGSYTIFGLPANTYQLYVHPLPPDAVVPGGEGLQLPLYDSGQQINASSPFQTVFYPGVQDPGQATQFAVTAGSSFINENFTVQAVPAVPTYDVETWSYLDPVSRAYPFQASQANYVMVTPAFMDDTQPAQFVVAFTTSGTPSLPTPQSVAIMGVGTANFKPFSLGSTPALQMSFGLAPFLGVGPRHLVLNFGSDIYVLPDAIDLVQKGPPVVNGITPNGDGTLTVSGLGFGPDSRVFFDGMQAAGAYNPASSAIVVTPPAGSSGQVSTVAVYNSDAQNSLLVQSQNPPTFTYPSGPAPQIQSVTPSAIAASPFAVPFSAKVDIVTAGTQFVDGQVTVGFGSSDISVTRVWVLSPTHLVANLEVAPAAAAGSFAVSVISGMQVIEQPGAFQLQGPLPLPQIDILLNGVTGLPGALYQGNVGVLYGLNLGQSVSSVQVTLNGAPAQILYASTTQVNFVCPPSVGAGPATLVMNNGSGTATLEVQMAAPPPAIVAISGASGGQSANPGDVLTATLAGFDSTVAANPSRLQVTVAGLPMTVLQIGSGQVQFVLTQSFGWTQVPVVVSVDGAPSAPFLITAR